VDGIAPASLSAPVAVGSLSVERPLGSLGAVRAMGARDPVGAGSPVATRSVYPAPGEGRAYWPEADGSVDTGRGMVVVWFDGWRICRQ